MTSADAGVEMDAKPKSNKQKRLEKKRKLELAAAGRAQATAVAEAEEKLARAERVLRETKAIRRDLPRFLQRLAAGEPSPALASPELSHLARLFASINREKRNRYPLTPDPHAFQRLVEVCWERTDLLKGIETLRYAGALLALSAHVRVWARRPGNWTPRSHNAQRQFQGLVRHLLALFDVPSFMDSVWLEGLRPAGVVHQRWFIHVAQGGNLRTASELPIPLTRRQAHRYLQAPADFDVLSAFRWAQVREMGGDERLARSIAGTRIGKSFDHDDFWVTVLRWLVEQPMLDPVHIGPIIDFLHDQRFVPSVPDRRARQPGRVVLVPPQPNLTMKGRDPERLLHSVDEWHRRLGRAIRGPISYWRPTGIEPFRYEEGEGDSRKVFTITELLNSHDLLAEGRAMAHCVASYAPSCVRGRVSIWSLRMLDARGRETWMLTLEVSNQEHRIVQARRKFNALPSPREIGVLQRWAASGGPAMSSWVAR